MKLGNHYHVQNVAFALYLNDRNLATLQRRYEQFKVTLAQPELTWETFLEIQLGASLSMALDDDEAREVRQAGAVGELSPPS